MPLRCSWPLAFFILLSINTLVFASEDERPRGSLQGSVLAADGQPLHNAWVRLYRDPQLTLRTAFTNPKGHFSFAALAPGNYQLEVTGGLGHGSIRQTVTITAGQVTDVGAVQVPKQDVQLQTLTIAADRNQYQGLGRLPEATLTGIFATKKSEVLYPGLLGANLAVNTTRQVFAKVPGIQIWENDGSGQQIGIAARGLSPNRSWDFNTRQNGHDIASDPFGYPEAYYNPPMEAVDRIEIVRGAGSLQYGSQFGGMVNYILKDAPTDKHLALESVQTTGSYGLFNTFNSLGGTLGRFSYYGFAHYRRADGWRQSGWYETLTTYGKASWQATDRLKLSLEYTRLGTQQRQPGGLTDSLFAAAAQTSYRPRNWFTLIWHMPALTLNYQVTDSLSLRVQVFTLLGDRLSVGNVSPLSNASPFEATASPRQVSIDRYRNAGGEARLGWGYALGGRSHRAVFGARFFTGNTTRQQGTGTSGIDADYTTTALTQDLYFGTQNVAFFAENMIHIGRHLIITPGIRYEFIRNTGKGQLGAVPVPDGAQARSIVLAGVGAEYHVNTFSEVYANFNQGYRPYTFRDQYPATPNEVVGTLADAIGYNAELGYRGRYKNIANWDVSVFWLQYNNRFGRVNVAGSNPPLTLITNVGNSSSQGVESFVEVDVVRAFAPAAKWGLSVFNSTAYINAYYSAINDANTTGVRTGNRVENAPQWIVRSGVSLSGWRVALTLNHSYVGMAYSDAANTQFTASGVNGVIPAYALLDANLRIEATRALTLSVGVNNAFNTMYFTRRSSGGYPGPGIIPADGRVLFVTAAVRL